MTTTTATASLGNALYTRGIGWRSPLPKHLNDPRTLVMAFGSSGLGADDPGLADLRAAFPDSTIVGCSTSGEVHGSTLWDDSLTVGVIRFRQATVRSTSAPVRGPDDSVHAGRLLAEQLRAPGLRAVLVFCDGLSVNGTALVKGLTSGLDPSVTITGGLAGDGTAFKSTWVLSGGRRQSRIVSAVGLYGPSLRVGHGSRGGWDVFGPERLVTRSQGNVLYELDEQPALELYKRYLGERSKDLPSSALLFPLAIRANQPDAPPLVRTVLSVDEASQSMTFAGDVPQGAVAQLMRANFERLILGASASAKMAALHDGDRPCLCIAVSCVGRRLVLGQRTEEELEATLSTLPPGSAQVGFYSYGEISPVAAGSCDLHNQTMTLTTLGED